MFEYSEEYGQKILVMNGIVFCCEEEQDGYIDEAKRLSEEYWDKLWDIAGFMLNDRLRDLYRDRCEELDAEAVKANLGTPQINLDLSQIVYCEQTLDDEHIFTVGYGEDLNDLMYCSADG